METEIVENQAAETEVAVVIATKKGQTTIPVKLRRKYKIEEGTKLAVIDTKEGILYKPKKSIWDKIGIYSNLGTPEEVKKELDKIRHEEEYE